MADSVAQGPHVRRWLSKYGGLQEMLPQLIYTLIAPAWGSLPHSTDLETCMETGMGSVFNKIILL
jgi:hypothetical protein